MTTSDFARLGVPSHLADALAPLGITTPTPIQAKTLPDSLQGRDVLGRGRTGSGKTYAFLLPLVARLQESGARRQSRKPHSLVLAPTRELAAQIAHSLEPLAAAAHLRTATVFGGVGQKPQVDALAAGIDVLVACPGRLLDLMGQGHVDLSAVQVTVLDEADHMADMGFLPMVRRILDKTPQRSQRMLFSATLDAGVDTIVKRYLHNPVTHEVEGSSVPEGVMEHHVLEVAPDDRFDVLLDLSTAPGRTIMFTRTKHGAKKLAKKLVASGARAVELHGNLSQGARTRNLEAFGSGAATTMVATDIAARGIHVDEVALVVHADPPVEHKAYLHRSGRTARAGESGTVVTVQMPEQRGDVKGLMRAAKIHPHSHPHVTTSSAVLQELAPGERVLVPVSERATAQNAARQQGQGGQQRNGRKQGQKQAGQRSGGQNPRGGRTPRGDRDDHAGQGQNRGTGGQGRGNRSGQSGRGNQNPRGGQNGGRGRGGSSRRGRGSGTPTTYSTSSPERGSSAGADRSGLAAFSSRGGH